MNIQVTPTVNKSLAQRVPFVAGPETTVPTEYYIARNGKRLQGVATVERVNRDSDRHIEVTFDGRMSQETREALTTRIKTDLDYLKRAYVFRSL